MIRESAYGRLLKRRRAELHEAYVRWAEVEQAARPGADELDEVLGYHIEQAHRYLRELGPLDDHGRAIGRHAAELLGAAGGRAFAREDMPAAATLLRSAALSLEPGDELRAPLQLLLAEALMDTGDFAAAQVQCEE